MDIEKRRQMHTHAAVSTIGGFLGAYAIINFCELFANAQTANMIHLVSNLIGGKFSNLIYIFASLLTYIAGNTFCVLYKKFAGDDLRKISLSLDFLAIAAVSALVQFTNANFVLLPILFVMPVQWNAFSGDAGYASSTIFSTNNLRQATMSLVSYITDKDKAQLEKAKFYWLTLLSFHIGAAFACVASLFLGANSILLGFVPAVFGTSVYAIQKGTALRFKRKIRRIKRSLKSA